MEGKAITRVLGGLKETAGNMPERRKPGYRRKYETTDFLMNEESSILFLVSKGKTGVRRNVAKRRTGRIEVPVSERSPDDFPSPPLPTHPPPPS
jgi:hypothetical protein